MIYRYILKKRHIKFSRVVTICVSLLFIVSCGIPTNLYMYDEEMEDESASYYIFDNPDDSDSDSDVITTTITFNIDSAYQTEDSPSICYFYSIYSASMLDDITDNTYASKITPSFKSTYSDLPGRYLANDPEVLSVSYLDGEIKLFKFTYDDLDQDVPYYLATIDGSMEYDEDVTATFSITQVTDSDNNIYFDFTETSNIYYYLNSSEELASIYGTNLTLKRYNGDTFISNDNISELDTDTDYDYVFNDDEDSSYYDNYSDYKIAVFAALNVTGEFTNIFWSDLQYLGSFDL